MKKFLIPLAVAAVSLAIAPVAQAAAQDFLADLYANGWYSHSGDANLLSNGYQVCRMLNNMNGTQAARFIYENTDSTVSRQDAIQFVILAVQDLCPWHDHRQAGAAA